MEESMVRNTAHPGHVARILQQGLAQGNHSDVTISVSGSKKLIRCHKSVLANSSSFMRSLLADQPEPEEPVNIHLCDISFSEAMAMLNIVYMGRVKIKQSLLKGTKAAAKAFLNLTVQVDPEIVSSSATSKSRSSLRPIRKNLEPSSCSSRKPPSSSTSRPLFIKPPVNVAPPPILVVLPPSQEQVPEPHLKLDVFPSQENNIDFSSLNSYQKAKLRCADKFKCDLCGKGFPLGCLLQRHKRTHLSSKPHSCNYCDKGFSSKTTLKHHLFMQHSNEKIKIVGEKERLLENLEHGPDLKCALNVDARTDGRAKQPVEINGVEDISPKIAVQMEKRGKGVRGMRDTVIEVVDTEGNVSLSSFIPESHLEQRAAGMDEDQQLVQLPHQQKGKIAGDNMYYIEAEGNYPWEYRLPTTL